MEFVEDVGDGGDGGGNYVGGVIGKIGVDYGEEFFNGGCSGKGVFGYVGDFVVVNDSIVRVDYMLVYKN